MLRGRDPGELPGNLFKIDAKSFTCFMVFSETVLIDSGNV